MVIFNSYVSLPEVNNCDLGKKDVLMAIGCLSTAQVESYWMMPQGSNPARLRWRTSSPLMFFVRKCKFHGIPFCRAMENLQGGWFPPTFPLLLDVPHILKTRIRFQFGKIEVDQFVFFTWPLWNSILNWRYHWGCHPPDSKN